MLRTLFVLGVTLVGGAASLRGPLEALLFYLWVAYFRPESWIYSGWFAAANISLISGVFVVVRMLVSSDRIRLDAGTWLLIAVVVHGGLSVALSPWSVFVMAPYVNFVKSIVIAVMIASLANTQIRLRLILTIIGLSLGADAAKQGWVYLLTMPGAANTNEIPFLGDNNTVAVAMFMLVPLVLALSETATRRVEKYFWAAMAIGIAYRGLSTYSRGGFLAAGALVVLYVVRARKHRIRKAAFAIAATALLLSTMPDTFWERMDTIQVEDGQERDMSAAGRLHFWKVAMRIAEGNPIFGVGNGGYNVAYNSFDDSGGLYGYSRSVHSSWFGLLSEGGYVGFLLVLLVLGRAILQCGRLCRRIDDKEPEWKYARSLQNSLLVFCLGGSFVALQYNEMFWHFMALTFGLSAFLEKAGAVSPAEPELKSLPMHPVAASLMRAPITSIATRN